VNGVEKQLEDQATVVRINLLTSVGRQLAQRFDVSSTGTTLVLDRNGKETWRHCGIPRRAEIIAAVQAPE
jgi:hypothetical protein